MAYTNEKIIAVAGYNDDNAGSPNRRVSHAGLIPLSIGHSGLPAIGRSSIHGSNSSPGVSSNSPHSGPASRRVSTQPERADSSVAFSTWPQDFSLESRPGHSHQLLGLSGESDPYFLRHYSYNEYDTYPMFRLHFRKVVEDTLVSPLQSMPQTNNPHPSPSSPVPLQFVLSDEAIWRDDVHAVESLILSNSTEETDTLLMLKLVSPELAVRLVKLYIQFVHPRYPVLSSGDLERISDYTQLKSRSSYSDDTIHQEPAPGPQVPREGWQSDRYSTRSRSDDLLAFPVGLRCAVYALAAPYAFLDDQLSVSRGYREGSTDELWAIAHRSFQRAHRLSHLSSLQLCLLLLQQPPQSYVAAEPPSFWSLSCTSVAIAENLGLGIDPCSWRLPRRETMLRRRLWWLTHTTHVWHAILCGRPSHIHSDDWDVTSLRPEDFEHGFEQKQIPICIAECELGLIAADVLREF